MICAHCETALRLRPRDGAPVEAMAEYVCGDEHTAERCRDALKAQRDEARGSLAVINTPEIADFLIAVEREAKHQRLRWPSDHDEGKRDSDWFWLIGWLAGKAVHANDETKRLHHIVTTAAACLNWHAQRMGASDVMRPGIESPHTVEAVQTEPTKDG